MKRFVRLLVSLCAMWILEVSLAGCGLSFTSMQAAGVVPLDGVDFRIDTLLHYQVGPGTWYTQARLTRLSDGQQRKDIYILQVERKNPYVTTRTVLANDSILVCERPSNMAKRMSTPTAYYFAGTNGDWWSTTRPGCPEGTFITDNTITITPGDGHDITAHCAITQNDSLLFGRDLTTDLYIIRNEDTVRCNHVNDLRGENQLILYNHYNGLSTRTDDSGSEAICRIDPATPWGTNTQMRLTVETIRTNQGSTPLQQGYVVLSGAGIYKTYVESLTPGESLTLDIHTSICGQALDFKAALGGQSRDLMLADGISYDTWNEQHPRTGLGLSQTGDTIIHCVVDGRGKSTGATCKVLGEIMRHFGAWWAMNMEGGGSSSMNLYHQVVNVPSDGSERPEPEGIFAVCIAPEDHTISRIAAYRESVRLPRYGMYDPDFIGYNPYDLIENDHLEGVTLTCDSTVGYIDLEGRFVCLGEGILYAHYGDIEAPIYISIDENAEPVLRMDSVQITPYSNYGIEVQAMVLGDYFTLQPEALQWMVEDTTIARVSQRGLLTAVSNGYTRVVGTLGNFTCSMIVHSFVPESNPLFWDDLLNNSHFSMKASSSSWNTALADGAEGTLLSMDFSGGRNANVKFTADAIMPGDPDTIIISYRPNGLPVQKVNVNLQAANNTTSGVNFLREDLPYGVGEEVELRIPVDSLFEGADQALYPITFHTITFTLDTSAPKQHYDLLFQGIWLVYPTSQQPEQPLNIEATPAPIKASIIRIDGHLGILIGNHVYDLMGRKIQ